MITEDTAALQFILTEQIYLSKNDIGRVEAAPTVAVSEITETVVVEEPAAIAIPLVAEPEPVFVKAPAFNYLGKNAKNFLIVCNYAAEGIDEKHLAALTGTLNRKELTIDDVAILDLGAHPEATVEQLNNFFSPQRLLILGVQSRLQGWHKLQLNQLAIAGNRKALFTDSFTDMMGDRDRTKAFWEQMKQL